MKRNNSNFSVLHLLAIVISGYILLIVIGKVPAPAFMNAAGTPGALATQAQSQINGTPTSFGSPVAVTLAPDGPYLTQISGQMPVITQTPSIVDKILQVTVQPTVDPLLLLQNIEVYRVPYDTSYMIVHEAPFVGIAQASQSLNPNEPNTNNTYQVLAVRVITVPVGVSFNDMMDDINLQVDEQNKALNVTLNVRLCALHPWEYRDDLDATDLNVPTEARTWWYGHLKGTQINYAGVTADALKAAWDNAVNFNNFTLVVAQGETKLNAHTSGWFLFIETMFDNSAKAVGLENGANVSVTVAPSDASTQFICGTTESVFTADPQKK